MDAEKHYGEVKDLFSFLINKFMQTHGGDKEDLLSICHLAYVMACQTYDPNKTKFSTWVYNYLWWKMLDYNRKEERRIKYFEEDALEHVEQKYCNNEPLTELYTILTDDAKCVCDVLLDLSPELLQSFKDSGKYVLKTRNAIKQLFLDLGWPMYRIKDAIRDLRIGLANNERIL